MPARLTQHESITLDPPAPQWRSRPGPPSPEARAFREQLALPTDRPIVMSGHQSAIWHAGIAAKVFALDACAARDHAATAWVIVDQDVGEPGRVRYPTRRDPRSESRSRSDAPALGATSVGLLAPWGADIITARQPPATPAPWKPEGAASPQIAASIERIRGALAAHTVAPSRAVQATRAAFDLLATVRGATPTPAHPGPTLLTATGLARTDLFASLLDRMRREPDRCLDAYNDAVARHPGARLRPLITDPARGREIPLWRVTPRGTRQPAFLGDADAPVESAPDALAPRALLMTALLRLGACDLFIHGLGGGVYDPVMEQWLDGWLGITDLAPAVVATATRLLPLIDDPPPTPSQVAHARWAAHHARHNPDPAVKRTLVAAVQSARTPADRAARFRDLHAWLGDQRQDHAADLSALDARARSLAAQAALSAVVFDRTWPFPLLPQESMRSLRDQVHAAF